MFGRKSRDPEIERIRVDLDGAFADVRVHLDGVPVSVRASGQRRLVDPDATIAWIDAVDQGLDLGELRRKSSACPSCGGPRPDGPVAFGPVTLDTPADTAGILTVTTQALLCTACGARYVATIAQFRSDVMDALIDALAHGEVKR